MYYDLLSDTDLPHIATVLDPRIKTHWIKEHCEEPEKVISRVRAFLKATYPPDAPLPSNTSTDLIQSLEYQFLVPYVIRPDSTSNNDIDRYLDSPRVEWDGNTSDDQTQWLLDWWHANSSQY